MNVIITTETNYESESENEKLLLVVAQVFPTYLNWPQHCQINVSQHALFIWLGPFLSQYTILGTMKDVTGELLQEQW